MVVLDCEMTDHDELSNCGRCRRWDEGRTHLELGERPELGMEERRAGDCERSYVEDMNPTEMLTQKKGQSTSTATSRETIAV